MSEKGKNKNRPSKLKVKWNQRFTSKKKDHMKERYLTKNKKQIEKISPMMILIKEFPKMNVPFYDSFEIKNCLYRILQNLRFTRFSLQFSLPLFMKMHTKLKSYRTHSSHVQNWCQLCSDESTNFYGLSFPHFHESSDFDDA